MAEAPKAKPAAGPAFAAKGEKKGPNPLMPFIAAALIIGGVFLLVYMIYNEPPPPKVYGGH
jgi:hypothetical protein